MPRFTDEQLDAEVLYVLRQHVGRKNPIGRWALVARIFGAVAPMEQNDGNIADRQIRGAVNRLRRKGVLVCDMGDGSGRYLAETAEEYREFRLKYGSRAYEVLETLKEMDKAAERQFDNPLQPRLI